MNAHNTLELTFIESSHRMRWLSVSSAKLSILLVIFVYAVVGDVLAQEYYAMPIDGDISISVCEAFITDDGGIDGDYSSGITNSRITISSMSDNEFLRITPAADFQVNDNVVLRIYDATDYTNQVASFIIDSALPQEIICYSGTATFRWTTSANSAPAAGFAFAVSSISHIPDTEITMADQEGLFIGHTYEIIAHSSLAGLSLYWQDNHGHTFTGDTIQYLADTPGLTEMTLSLIDCAGVATLLHSFSFSVMQSTQLLITPSFPSDITTPESYTGFIYITNLGGTPGEVYLESFPDFLVPSASNIIISPGATDSLAFNFSSPASIPGWYEGDVLLSTNDTTQVHILEHIQFQIHGHPFLEMTPSSIQDIVYTTSMNYTDTVLFYNSGDDTLHIQDILFEQPVIYEGDIETVIPPNTTMPFVFGIYASDTGYVQTQISIITEDTIYFLPVNFQVESPPIIALNDYAPSYDVIIGDSLHMPLIISNNGQGPLVVNYDYNNTYYGCSITIYLSKSYAASGNMTFNYSEIIPRLIEDQTNSFMIPNSVNDDVSILELKYDNLNPENTYHAFFDNYSYNFYGESYYYAMYNSQNQQLVNGEILSQTNHTTLSYSPGCDNTQNLFLQPASPLLIEAGSSDTLWIDYDTNDFLYADFDIDYTLTLHTNDTTDPHIIVPINIMLLYPPYIPEYEGPHLELTQNLPFHSFALSDQDSQNIHIFNNGSDTLHITDLLFECEEFSAVFDTVTIFSGNSFTIPFHFDPVDGGIDTCWVELLTDGITILSFPLVAYTDLHPLIELPETTAELYLNTDVDTLICIPVFNNGDTTLSASIEWPSYIDNPGYKVVLSAGGPSGYCGASVSFTNNFNTPLGGVMSNTFTCQPVTYYFLTSYQDEIHYYGTIFYDVTALLSFTDLSDSNHSFSIFLTNDNFMGTFPPPILVTVPDWLYFDGDPIQIEPGTEGELCFHVNTTYLTAGDYSSNIVLASDDLDAPFINIPVTLHLAGSSICEMSNSTWDLGVVEPYSNYSHEIYINNPGQVSLQIPVIDFATPGLEVVSQPHAILPNTMDTIVLGFYGITPGIFHEEINITDTPCTSSIIVSGEVLITGREELITDSPHLIISPSPARDLTTIFSSVIGSLNIRDLTGSMFYTQPCFSGYDIISTGDWPSGIYMIDILGSEQHTVAKLVVQH